MFAFYALALVIVFLGVILNLPGSLHINPLLLHFYEPHKVLFLTMVFLVLGAIARIIVLWEHILWREALYLAVWGFFGGIVGGYFVGSIPQKIIVSIFFISGFWYIYKFYTRDKNTQPHKVHGAFMSGFVTAVFQAFGLSVGVIRQGYLFSRGHDLQTVQATAAVVFITGGITTIVTRILHEGFPVSDTLSILALFPFMLITVYLGKLTIYKMPKKIQEAIILYSLILSLLSAVPYLLA
jgi:uncharacterized membrane protein YfcA